MFKINAKSVGTPGKLFTRVLIRNRFDHDLKAAYVNALWDTGSEFCIISKTLARMLGYDLDADKEVVSYRDLRLENFGLVRVSLESEEGNAEAVAKIGDDVLGENYSFIIGMNLISQGCLSINSSMFETELSFTHCYAKAIDYESLVGMLELPEKENRLSGWEEDIRILYKREALDVCVPEDLKLEFNKESEE